MKAILLLSLALTYPVGARAETSVAMTGAGKPVVADKIFAVGKDPETIVDKFNAHIELAPYSVVEFDENAEMKLLRGSALVEGKGDRALSTSTANIDFNGKILVSYDHKQRSSSLFVLDGQARMKNPAEEENSLRLDRLRGATLEVGGVLPQLVRQLDFTSLDSWMKGYAWPEARRAAVLRGLPSEMKAGVEEEDVPAHLEGVKIEDYFSAIDNSDDSSQPDYYERKFADPDAAMAEAKATKAPKKGMSPEEAALITLPSTRIDLGFSVLGHEQYAHEMAKAKPRTLPKQVKRSLASVPAKPKKAPEEPSQAPTQDGVTRILDRLRGLEPKEPVVSSYPTQESRGPASVSPSVVPDPVYDYSENF